MKAREFIAELFDTVQPLNIVRQYDDELVTETTINNKQILFRATTCYMAFPLKYKGGSGKDMRLPMSIWNVDFCTVDENSPRKQFNITGGGDQFKIFAFVLASMKILMKNLYGVDAIYFSAESNAPSRVALYNRMLKMFPKTFIKVKIPLEFGEVQFFIITKSYLRKSIEKYNGDRMLNKVTVDDNLEYVMVEEIKK